ncbi:hypothetical protein H9Y04_17870 [Streptomyces sp. TRM66268-LWL]|uniref:Glycosyltransferase RgtA/B/C/D-like domain-containing protein n=1 Tax=Streptomyces polyasparticus TaxID=2767826 RepID=A0ABR7SI98_9ACTN|nr:hypothetical protein [Streptomyces polyasparticus]MBC9714430.1 hypothetical protein [Streptomyces polyasparticus]
MALADIAPRLRTGGLAVAREPAVAVLAYLAARAAGAIALAGWALAGGRPLLSPFTQVGDARWYLAIARHGYAADVAAYPNPKEPMAFFPLYPWLVRTADLVLPFDTAACALLLSWSAALLTALGLFRLGTLLHGPRTGVLLAVLWGVLPHAVVESMAYTESLFTACAVWSLYAVLRGQWVAAAALAVAAGLTRPTGIAVVAAVCVAALAALLHRRRPYAPLLAALFIAPLGWAGYVLWSGRAFGGGLTGYFAIQGSWGSHYDFGAGSLHLVADQLAAGRPEIALALVTAGAALVALIVVGVRQRQPLPLLVFSTVLVAIVLGGDGYFHSRPRFLLPAFGLLLPLAVLLSRLRTRTAAAVLAAAAVLSALCGVYLVAHTGTAVL